ncbi:MAG TPA: hypothetical protein VKE51_01960 [Vicinamibacterales bacterium]|nr:hypothetical protein [Vicinamibacterales bacterium]
MARVFLACCAAVAIPALVAVHARSDQSAPQAQAARAIGTRITFTVTQSTEFAAGSKDQITIIFSDRSWNGPVAPTPIFGDDILQEFSFSARDFEPRRNSLTFTRYVKDQSFLSARFIRVVNHGGEGWGGGTLSMSIDGQPAIERVALTPRKGAAAKGLQNWNRERWSDRTYWEEDLPKIIRRYKY